jgi:hypothetical protein
VIIDENDAPWIAGFEPDEGAVWRWDRKAERFDAVSLVTPDGEPPVAIAGLAPDGEGSIWVTVGDLDEAVHGISDERILRITNEPGMADDLENRAIATPGVHSFGAAVDFDSHLWTFDALTGSAAVIDLETEVVQDVLDDCSGEPCLPQADVRGDITGLQLATMLGRSGTWSNVVEGCADGATDWISIAVEAVTPPSSSLAVSARTAETSAELRDQPWTALGTIPADESPFNLDAAFGPSGIEDGHLIEVQVLLRSMSTESPVLQRVEVRSACSKAGG